MKSERIEARDARRTFYNDLQTCKNGHIAPRRYTSSGACEKCLKGIKADTDYKIFKPRDVALSSGATRYNSGKQCTHGHWGDRWTSTGQCIECTQRYKPIPRYSVLAPVDATPELHDAFKAICKSLGFTIAN